MALVVMKANDDEALLPLWEGDVPELAPLPPLATEADPPAEPEHAAAEVAAPVAAVAEPLALFGRDLFGNVVTRAAAPLAERFVVPPFSVLNAREGEWQERKRAWTAMGIKGEMGRAEGLLAQGNGNSAAAAADLATRYGADEAKLAAGGSGIYGAATSVFDPVLCELAYKWWCPPGGQVLDPFAGGSVRGLVAGMLGFRYHGIDLRAEQLAANAEQREAIAPTAPVVWECGDSMDRVASAPEADFVFTCPPYGDLERYSDNPADLSTMEYATFVAAYKRIILRCSQRLRPNRLACFVVGDFRDKRGMYRGFVADTINAFREVGLELYNDAVLVTAVGSLPVRVSAAFDSGRKLGKTHQNVLCFAKGDPRKAFA